MLSQCGKWSAAVLCVSLANLISGCADLSPQDVRDRPRSKVVYIVKDDYQVVYQQLLDGTRDHPDPYMAVHDSIRTDVKEASLALKYADGIFLRTYWVIDLRALDNGQTQAILYIRDPSEGRVARQWLAKLGAERIGPK